MPLGIAVNLADLPGMTTTQLANPRLHSEPMTDTSMVNLDTSGPHLIARVQAQKVGSREAQVIENELRSVAPTRVWKIAIDLSEVTLLASMGLGMLVSLHKACAQNGGKLVICGLRGDLLTLLKITHLERVLKIVPDLDAAKKALA